MSVFAKCRHWGRVHSGPLRSKMKHQPRSKRTQATGTRPRYSLMRNITKETSARLMISTTISPTKNRLELPLPEAVRPPGTFSAGANTRQTDSRVTKHTPGSRTGQSPKLGA